MAKTTKKEMFTALRALVENVECENKDGLLGFLSHEIESLDKRHEKSSTSLTKTQKENLSIMEEIKDALFEVAKPVTITELVAATPTLGRYSSQKLSALLKLMKDRGEVIRTEDKKKAYFSLPNAD